MIFATPQQIASGFLLFGRNVDRRQRPGAIQDSQLARVTPIGFDAITGTPRNEGWGDDLAGDVARGDGPLEVKAAAARFVTALHRAVPAEALNEPKNRRTVPTARCAAPAFDGPATGQPPPWWPRADRRQ